MGVIHGSTNLFNGGVDQIKAYCCYLDWSMWSGDTAVIEKLRGVLLFFWLLLLLCLSLKLWPGLSSDDWCTTLTPGADHWVKSLTSAPEHYTEPTEQRASEAQVCHLVGPDDLLYTQGVPGTHTCTHEVYITIYILQPREEHKEKQK